MSSYLTLVNRVLDELRWRPLEVGEFDDPPRQPGRSVKRLLNEAKDEVLTDLGLHMQAQEFAFTTVAPVEGTNGHIMRAGTWSGPGIDVDYVNRKFWQQGAGDAWFRITNHIGFGLYRYTPTLPFSTPFGPFIMFQDEYNLDSLLRTPTGDFQDQPNRVRQVLGMWSSRGPMRLRPVSEHARLDRFFPGSSATGAPVEYAVFRGLIYEDYERWIGQPAQGTIDTTPFIVQLYPAPDDEYEIRFKARTAFPDLVSATDGLNLEAEVETLIVTRTVVKVLNTPLANEPDLATSMQRDLRRMVSRARREPDRSRRLRRRGSDEAQMGVYLWR